MPNTLTKLEREILKTVQNRIMLPFARLELRSTREDELVSTALNHVWITDPADSMELVKARSEAIRSLMERGLIAVYYHVPVTADSDYRVYEESSVFASLCALVEDGVNRPDFLFDTAAVCRGVAFPTSAGSHFHLVPDPRAGR